MWDCLRGCENSLNLKAAGCSSGLSENILLISCLTLHTSVLVGLCLVVVGTGVVTTSGVAIAQNSKSENLSMVGADSLLRLHLLRILEYS